MAGLVYAANPMFLPWSSTFSYENLALPVAGAISVTGVYLNKEVLVAFLE